MEDILTQQRALLARHVNPDASKVPQAFVPYKEVLPIYQNGLNVPDDVTLAWPDDNYGYIRRLSNPVEQKRSGGAGVYYHLSYWGTPDDYLWLDSTPPALIWEEMSRAYDHGTRTIWVANVGDIKAIETGMTFFLRLAWNPKAFDANCQQTFLKSWATQVFGPAVADEAAAVLDEYYRLNLASRPEHTPWNDFSWDHYGEAQTRIDRFAKLAARAEAVYASVGADRRDACYQLLVYPVQGAALANEKALCAAHARQRQATDPVAAKAFVDRARAAHAKLEANTRLYNDTMAGGKWRHAMSFKIRNNFVFRPIGDAGEFVPAKPSSGNPTSRPVTHVVPSIAPLPPLTHTPPADFDGFVDVDGVIAMEAEHATRRTAAGGAAWAVVPGLGRSGDAIAALPATKPDAAVPDVPTADQLDAIAPSLQFDVFAARGGPAGVLAFCLPTHAVNDARKLRYAVAIDRGPPSLVNIDSLESSKPWQANVLRNAAVGHAAIDLTAGRHTLTVWAVDPAIVLDKLVIDLGGLKPSFNGPPETRTATVPRR